MDADTKVKIVLFVLQVFALVITLVYAAEPKAWLSWVPSFGIGKCRDDTDCWSNQMIYRTESVCFGIFVVNAILSMSGCTPTSVMGSLPSFSAIVFLPLILTLLPNDIFHTFSSSIAVTLSSCFLIMMSILLVDFAQTMNDAIFGVGISARRLTFNSDYLQAAKIVLIVLSVLLLVGGIAGTIALSMNFANGWVVVVALVISLILLVLSITEWCEHGCLFASCLVLGYSMWLSYQALITQDDLGYSTPTAVKWIGLIIAFLTLGASIFGSGFGLGGQEPMLPGLSAEGGPSRMLFVAQALVHAFAALYILTLLAPSQSSVGFVCRVVALFLSLLLYAWTLVAPKLFPSRFG